LLASACVGGPTYLPLTTDNPVASLSEGLTVSVNPALMPADFGVQLSAVPAETFMQGQAGKDWAAARDTLPASLQLKSGLFQIKTRGTLPEQLFISVSAPAGLDPAVLDLYAWNGTRWEFLPSRAQGGQLVASVSQPPSALGLFESAPQPPLAFTLVRPGQSLSQVAAEASNAVLLQGVLLQPDGSLGGQVPGVPQGQGYAVYPVVSDRTDGAPALAGVLADDAVRMRHLQDLLSFVVSGAYDGVVLDYASVTPEMGPAFAQFVADLAVQMHAQSKALFVLLPPPTLSGDAFQTGGYDWRVLGASADALLVPVGDDPAAYGSLAGSLLGWAVGEVPRQRLRLLTSAMSVDAINTQYRLVDQAAALAPLGSVALSDAETALNPGNPISVRLSGAAQSFTYDPLAFAARYDYTDDGGQLHQVWLTTAATLRQRFGVAETYRLGGVAVSDLMAAGIPADSINAVTQYKAAVQEAAAAHAELLWTVRGADGVLALATAQPGQPYVYVPPSAGVYEFSANVQPGLATPLGSLAVQVAAIESSPTPEPTATSEAVLVPSGGGTTPVTPAPTQEGGAPTAVPTVPANTGGGGVFVPPAPIGAGNFQLGGQVPGFIGHPELMQQAGMTWVKFQATGDAAGFISAGHAAGFKVLLSAVGDRNRAADPAYWPEYAGWVAGMAAAGADAIEIWNEANIDREWPKGQISGATYTGLLQQAYNAIKGANSGTMVISGAPAPTGAEGAFPGSVVNDDNFLRQMANAGAANYMDCVGIHFNTGTTSPNDTTGSALSGYHYSYYFWPMIDTYYSAFGGTRPLCFTELGYLTPEGYGGLPGAFGWAANTSLAEQAQWLAESASLAGNSGKVRLMIVFNVDFTLYGDDPQGGYGMLRPDGSCPACSALGAVVH
jgi:hypothetical protein